MKYKVGQFLLSLTSSAYNYKTGMYDLPVIYKITEVLPYALKVNRHNSEDEMEIRKSQIGKSLKLLSPVEMELYEWR